VIPTEPRWSWPQAEDAPRCECKRRGNLSDGRCWHYDPAWEMCGVAYGKCEHQAGEVMPGGEGI